MIKKEKIWHLSIVKLKWLNLVLTDNVKGQQRYRCMCCGKTKTDSKIKHFDEVAQKLTDKMLKENISIRAIGRILGFNYTTILKYVRKKP